ncbi:unnamed protein product [Brachionus calyciflorus]|uniref:Uncharacterized protein n=1 Tax=Brachionus calyciflorus TaxID=104777 RepID=A0A813VPG7_9BILA|nr:unnamed protein product [Brachionus calyciflorus]
MDKSFDDDEDVIDKNHSNDENLILYESNSGREADEDEVETKQLSKFGWSFQLRTRVTQTNNGYNSTSDDQHEKSHLMTIRYRRCSSKVCSQFQDNCPARFKTLSCKIDNFFKVFSNGNHLGQIRNSNEEDSKYGIVSPIKELMKKIIKDKDFGPVRIHSYLVSNKQKIKEEYNLENFIIPNLVQIRNFKAAYKREIGNNNKIRHVIDFIKTHMFDYNLKDDEIFFFGLKLDNDDEPVIGTGTDDNHCHILLTTKRMLKFLDDL